MGTFVLTDEQKDLQAATVVVVTVVVIVAAAMAAVVTDINRTRLPVCQNRLIEEMPGICSGHLFL